MGSSSSREDFERRQSEATYQARLKTDDGIAARERSMAAEPADQSPDTAAAMDKLFEKQNTQRSQESDSFKASQNRAAYVKSQRDYFESVSDGMSFQGIIDRGGVQLASTQSIESGAAGMIAAGGERKGGYASLGSGAAGIVAAGGRKTTPYLSIESTFQDSLAVARWGAGMQRYRTLVRQYERKEREKKKNDGGLTAARETHKAVNFFKHRPMFTTGGVLFSPMTFEGAIPIVGTFKAAEEGWCPVGDAQTDTMMRSIMQAGRVYRASQPR
jgi:hypothetical protein